MPDILSKNGTDSSSSIRVFGARTHNLQNINVEIPRERLTVITGISGSGKSSLAFDTIFAEGRHRYLSSVSSRSQELLQGVDRPDVDFVDGLPPVICIEQRQPGVRKRSTVATVSEIYDYLRLLFARVGVLHCPACHSPVSAQSRTAIFEQTRLLQNGQKVMVLAPIIRSRAGSHSDVFARIVKDGYVRARVDGEVVDASSPPEISASKPHDIDIIVDRLIIKEGVESRLEESIDLALQLGQGQCVLSHNVDNGWHDRLFSSRFACGSCGTSFPAIEPRSFNFNSPLGACSNCHGLGSIETGESLETTCEMCSGSRLGTIPRSVRIGETSITDFCLMQPGEALALIHSWTTRFESISNLDAGKSQDIANRAAAKHILPEILVRLKFLLDVGLKYLTLDRGCDTLSAGELQRTRLAACLGSQMSGVCYILDEPTSGLHSSDTQRLLRTLMRLRDNGNTLLMVEHDLEVISSADYVIDLGPGAGILGGKVLATGAPDELVKNPNSITGTFLGRDHSKNPASLPRSSDVSNFSVLRLSGATLHNLGHVTIEIPLRRIVCVTGVSGSGKTSLIMKTLVPAIRIALGEKLPAGGPFSELSGFETLSRLVRIDQSPLGRSPRLTPATYSGIWDEIRQIFAKTKESRLRGFSPRYFSLGTAEARCPRCAGRGMLPVDEHRFADWNVRCPECDGRRFGPATLSVRYRSLSIADVLDLSIADAAAFFQNFPRLFRTLSMFNDLGLGYLKLGQPASTFSGGEAQRIKLGSELAKSSTVDGSALFVLDEPTSGLHVADVQQLVTILRRLVDTGHSVLVVEHNVELIASSDWEIELGPGAGPEGGKITFAGVPTQRTPSATK